MNTIKVIEARRDAIVKQMCAIRSLRRGTISQQFLKSTRGGGEEPVRLGPYFVLSRREGKKTVSQRLQAGAELEQARKDVEEHKRFIALCKEFEELTERLGQHEREQTHVEREKKLRSSPSRKTRR
jgi:hypothetical protein